MRLEQDWEMVGSAGSFKFGTIGSDFSFSSAPAVGAREFDTEDSRLPGSDASAFGVDLVKPPPVTFEIDVLAADLEGARAKLAALSRVWRGDGVRRTPGEAVMLKAPSGRVAFGRPRRFEAADDYNFQGVSRVTCDFQCVDDLWYGPEGRADLQFRPQESGGFTGPFVFPLADASSTDRSSSFRVAGDVATWPVYTVQGPITHPEVEVIGEYRLRYGGSLAYDEALVIDTRPFRRTVTVNGAPVALRPSSDRLAAASLAPGSHVMSLHGTSMTGTASVSVEWRDAYTTY